MCDPPHYRGEEKPPTYLLIQNASAIRYYNSMLEIELGGAVFLSWKFQVQFSVQKPVTLNKIFCGFPQSLQVL
jgi:hypothetical protein